jgi:hypothetical protein
MRRSGPYFESLSAPQPIKLCGSLGMHPGGRLAAILRSRKVPCVDSGDLIHRRSRSVPDDAAGGSGTSRGSLARSTLALGQAGYPSQGRCLASWPDAPHRTRLLINGMSRVMPSMSNDTSTMADTSAPERDAESSISWDLLTGPRGASWPSRRCPTGTPTCPPR